MPATPLLKYFNSVFYSYAVETAGPISMQDSVCINTRAYRCFKLTIIIAHFAMKHANFVVIFILLVKCPSEIKIA